MLVGLGLGSAIFYIRDNGGKSPLFHKLRYGIGPFIIIKSQIIAARA